MLATTHFVVTTGLLLVAEEAGLAVSQDIIIWTYLLGNIVDVDHVLFFPRRSMLAVKEFFAHKTRAESGKYDLHSYLQEPVFVLTALIISATLYLFNRNLAIFLPASALALHVAMDALAKSRNYLLWPISKKPFRGFITNNTMFEYGLSIVLTAAIIYLSFKQGLFHL